MSLHRENVGVITPNTPLERKGQSVTQHKYRCLIAVKAAKQAAANNYWKRNIDLSGGDKTFTQGLSATGNAPATWYWCSTQLQKWQLRKLVTVADANSADVRIVIWVYRDGVKQELLDVMDGRAYITIADNEQTPQDFLTAFNMKVIQPT